MGVTGHDVDSVGTGVPTQMQERQVEVNAITERVIGAAIAVHRELGPGLLESMYQACLAYELTHSRLRVERQVPVPVVYKGRKLDCGYRIDLMVERTVVVELKAIERFDAIHSAQLLTYLKLSGLRVGLLINFNVALLREGIRRIVLNLPEPPRAQRAPR